MSGERNRRVRLGRRFGVALLLALVGSVVPAAAASAADWDLCAATGYHCVYKNNNGSDGGVKSFSGNDPGYGDNNYSRCYFNCSVGDSVSSMWNREGYTVRSYINSSYGGSAIDTGSGNKRFSLSGGYNDALSSHQGI